MKENNVKKGLTTLPKTRWYSMSQVCLCVNSFKSFFFSAMLKSNNASDDSPGINGNVQNFIPSSSSWLMPGESSLALLLFNIAEKKNDLNEFTHKQTWDILYHLVLATVVRPFLTLFSFFQFLALSNQKCEEVKNEDNFEFALTTDATLSSLHISFYEVIEGM